jgi:type IV pilus assembly protein PilC
MASDSSTFQIVAKDRTGRSFMTYISATSQPEAKRKAKTHPKLRDATVVSVRKKRTFAYRVEHGGKTIDGYQNAYSNQEVVAALERIGFKVKFVRRQLEFRLRAASNEIVSFIATSARLMEQKLPYNEVLQVMATNLKGALRDIILDLKNGVDSREAFVKQGKVFGEHTALMLGIASKSGNMTQIFKSVATLVERQADFRKGLISSMILPAVTGLSLVGAIGFYVFYLLPDMMNLMGPMLESMPPLTAKTMAISAFMKDYIGLILFLGIGSIVGFYAYIFSPDGRINFHRAIVRVPYVGNILRNTTTEIFCRILGIMYASAGENIESIQLAGEASGNRYLAHQIKKVTVPMMLKFGTELGKALEAAEFFPELFISRFKTAAETGAVKDTALQLADYYQMDNQYAMKNLVSFIEVGISIIIMVTLVFLTLLSSETATLRIKMW